MKTLKYFSTLIVFAVAICAAWWMWNYYMQSPWTRDGKIRADVVDIASNVNGVVVNLPVDDNQFVKKGDLLMEIDPVPFKIEIEEAKASLATAEASLEKANNEYQRRRNMRSNVISKEELDEARIATNSAQAQLKSAQAALEKANWKLSQTRVYAPVDGYISHLKAREGRYALLGVAMIGLIDANSFYVQGYFEETKLKHIQEGYKADITLYSNQQKLSGVVESIGRGIVDQSEGTSSELLSNIQPNVPWVRLAQRIPVRIKLTNLPDDLRLIAGTTCTISVYSE
ncbi:MULTISPECIES: efflux RND transporter periplasmic adaptor subunit [Vibrio]|nr:MULTISPECIES: HlyD family secretion protein [Vibrio]SJN29621.1 Fusaric acid resistance protein fusE [Vibrio casei]